MAEEHSIIELYDLDKSQILERKKVYPKVVGIYFLIKDSEIVYVGKSLDILPRIAQHSREGHKEFDSYSILECPIEHLAVLEAYFMFKLRPSLNVTLPSNQLYKSFQQIKRIHDISALVLKLWMKHKAIETDKDGLYRLGDFDELVNFKGWMREHHPNIYLRQCPVWYLRKYIQELNASSNGAG